MLKRSMGRSLPFSRDSWVSAVLQGSVSAVLQGEEVAALLRSPTRAEPREGKKRLLRSPRLMGGLTRGRVRSAYGVEDAR